MQKNVRNNTNPSIKPSTVQWNALKFHSVRVVLTIVLYHSNIETIHISLLFIDSYGCPDFPSPSLIYDETFLFHVSLCVVFLVGLAGVRHDHSSVRKMIIPNLLCFSLSNRSEFRAIPNPTIPSP